MIEGNLIIYFINPNSISQEESFFCLSPDELSRSESFHFEADAQKWSAYRGALRKIISSLIHCPVCDILFVYSEYGKPALAPPYDWLHFNISHTDDLALLAVSRDGPVGIDIESKKRASDLLDCESSICHYSELANLPTESKSRSLQLLKLWTKKEAFLKATGIGLSLAPDTLRIPIHQDSFHHLTHFEMIEFRGLGLVDLSHDRLASHSAVVCCPLTINEIHFKSFEDTK
jgi:4'-phosphopantetheinyl transferase